MTEDAEARRLIGKLEARVGLNTDLVTRLDERTRVIIDGQAELAEKFDQREARDEARAKEELDQRKQDRRLMVTAIVGTLGVLVAFIQLLSSTGVFG